eukprot:CAMPEP_0114568146 /NCGR_PEP_ID=MMETSP0114-20121206/15895_1 /TAXON_ID=31324 /ORGANISM="Goniomonas sp, Strain m" /LENGTH=72 /DNA_ID=CAMNT_0001754855 /DNA_START=147 /DNA_END=365 /DNA_ORIENTATION=-
MEERRTTKLKARAYEQPVARNTSVSMARKYRARALSSWSKLKTSTSCAEDDSVGDISIRANPVNSSCRSVVA